MNKKLGKIFWPGLWVYFTAMVLFVAGAVPNKQKDSIIAVNLSNILNILSSLNLFRNITSIYCTTNMQKIKRFCRKFEVKFS